MRLWREFCDLLTKQEAIASQDTSLGDAVLGVKAHDYSRPLLSGHSFRNNQQEHVSIDGGTRMSTHVQR